MQEVFEKIIDKLEKELKLADDEKLRCVRENHLQFDSTKGYANGVANSIEIVKQVTAEFATDTNVGDNGWILISDQLPKNDCCVWISFSKLYGDFVRKAYWRYDYISKEKCFQWENGKRMKDTPIAWKPYYTPEPYHLNEGKEV